MIVQTNSTNEKNIYQELLLNSLKSRVLENKINMLIPSLFISEEATSLAFIFNHLFGLKNKNIYKTFMANSEIEAFSGAIRLARHIINKKYKKKMYIAVYETDAFFSKYFYIKKDKINNLIDGIFFINDEKDIDYHLFNKNCAGVCFDLNMDDLSDYRKKCRELNKLFIANEAALKINEKIIAPDLDPDITIYGRNMGEYVVPFGCFVIRNDIYQVWDNNKDCHAHSSTFGGNGLIIEYIIKVLYHKKIIDEKINYELLKISNNYAYREKIFRRHINNKGAKQIKKMGLYIDLVKAKGIDLEVKNNNTVLDTAGCYGCNLRGHNNDDLISGVVNKYKPGVNYTEKLEKRLKKITGFYKYIPSVSGTSATDLALLVTSLLKPNKLIVTFTGNYSGKSLLGMNLSRTSPIYVGVSHDYFKPYSELIYYVDPYSRSAVSKLKKILTSGNVALVWSELIQGSTGIKLPEKIITIINRYKDEYGYLVGVDEVLTGNWRAGEGYFYHQSSDLKVDMAITAKAMSDSTYPIGGLFLNRRYCMQLKREHSESFDYINSYYKDDIGSLVALNAIEKIDSDEKHIDRKENNKYLFESLDEIVKKSIVFSDVIFHNNLVRILIDKRKYKIIFASPLILYFTESIISRYINKHTNVLSLVTRLNLPIFCNRQDLTKVLNSLDHVLINLTLREVYFDYFKSEISYLIKKLRGFDVYSIYKYKVR